MATLFGLEINTPEEIRTAGNAALEQKKGAAKSPRELAALSQQQIMFNGPGNPALAKAERTQAAVSRVMQENPKDKDEDEYDYQVRVTTELRNQLAGINPELALQANDKILGLTTAKTQQKKLVASADEADQSLQDAKEKARKLKQPVLYGMKSDGGKIPIEKLPLTATPEEMQAAIASAQEKYGDQFASFDVGSELSLLNAEDLDLGPGNGGRHLSTTTIAKRQDAIIGASVLFNSISGVSKELMDNPYVLQPVVGDALGFTSKLQNTWNALNDTLFGSALRANNGNKDAAEKVLSNNEGTFSRVISNSSFAGTLQSDMESSGVLYARVKALAYTLAKTLDPGGRLSDQDVEMALQMILGNSDPMVITKLFNLRMEETHVGLKHYLNEAEQGDYGDSARSLPVEYYKYKQTGLEDVQKLAAQVTKMREEAGGAWGKGQEFVEGIGGGDKPKPTLAPERIKEMSFQELINSASGGK